jgi:hypothetical protein
MVVVASARVGFDALADQPRDREVGEDGNAEIAVQHVPGPLDETDQERLVEPELVADLGDVVGGRQIACDERCGIAGGEIKEREHEHADDHHHRQRRYQAPHQVDVQCALLELARELRLLVR